MISTREFFKTGKFRSRKQKSPQDLAISSYPSRNASIVTTNTNSTSWTAPLKYTRIMRRKPPPPPLQGNLPSTDPDSFSQSTRELDDTMREATNVIPPFQGLPSTRLISPGLLGDDEYRALGLHTSDTKRTHAFQNGSQHILSKLSSEESTVHETFEMDVPPHTSRANRPDLQVRIPANTPPLRSPNLLSARNGGPTPPSAISSSSSLPTGRNPRSATTATPYSMVSPLTGVEQQNSRRPFSAESTKVITKYNSPTPQQRIDERYQRSERSRRGSISDNFEIETPRPGETPVLGNATQLRFDSTNLYHAALIPAAIKTRKFVNTNPLTIHRKGSSVSVMSNADVNKPLPPEPPGGPTRSETSPAPLRHIAYSSCPSPSRSQHQIPSRSNSIIKRNNRSPQLLSEPSSPETMKFASANVTRRSSQSSMTRATALRSKYTPKDLDSMDEAVQRRINGNSAYQTPTRSRNPTPPNQSQISLIDQNYLHTITENSPRTSHALSVMDEPLQISRGPMKMEPSRRAPQPPAQPLRVHAIEVDKAGKITSTISRTQSSNSMNTLHKVDTDKQGKRQLAVPRTKSSNSINSVQEPLRKRAMPVAHSSPELKNHEYTSTEQNGIDGRTSEWPSAEKSQKERKNIDRMNAERVSKADRVLGLDRTSAMSRSVYEARPQTQESVRLAEQQSTEDFHEVRGKQDAHFEEIEDRLRLLRAKEDPAVVFTAFHQNDSYSQGKKQEKLRSYEPIQSENKATIEEKLHLSGTLRGNPIVPMFIAELEANPASSSVELNRSDVTKSTCSIVHEEGRKIGMAELLLPSPNTLATIPIPPEPIDQSHRRGRLTGSIPQSSISGKTKSILSTRSVRVRSLASIAASDIPDFYANAPTQGTYSKRPSMTDSEYEDVISADAAEQVLLHILKGLDNLEDLFAAALVSKGFYRTFKRHELFLLKHAIWKMSPAAWELREMSIPYGELDSGLKDYTPALYFRYYVQDLLTMVELKAMILESCKSFLRPETISGLAGETERSAMIDEAFWRVWTFCKIFGCYTQRDEDIVGQMDWLKGGVIAGQSSDTRTLALTDELARNSVLFNPPNGFARGNGKQGLSAEELYDMIEIWTCLGVLVRGYHGKRNEAREYGVYDRCNVTLGDIISENAMLGMFLRIFDDLIYTNDPQRNGLIIF